MKPKNRAWAVSLIAIGAATAALAGANLMGIQLPDIATRLLGGVDLLALPVLAFSTIKRAKSRGDGTPEKRNSSPQ